MAVPFFYFQIQPYQPLLNNRIRGMCDAHSPIRIKHYEQITYGTETTGEIYQRFTHLYTDTGLPSDFTRTTYTPAGKPSNETAWADGTLSVRNKCPAKSKISTSTFLSPPLSVSYSLRMPAPPVAGALTTVNPALFSTLTATLGEAIAKSGILTQQEVFKPRATHLNLL